MTGLVVAGLIVVLIVVVGGIIAWRRRRAWAATCDLRRCIVIIGPEQNHKDCVAQRRALKPLLIRVRHLGMNVIEVYDQLTPRRNGRPLEWMQNSTLRRALNAQTGFHLLCFDDDGDVMLHGRRPVSQAMLSEFIASEEPLALPAPDPITERIRPAAGPGTPAAAGGTVGVGPVGNVPPAAPSQTSWGSVGVLR